MKGPEHYREAERLLEVAKHPQRVAVGVDPSASRDAPPLLYVIPELDRSGITEALAAAQVHATLALAAAMVSPMTDWSEVNP